MMDRSTAENGRFLLEKKDGVQWVRDTAGIVVINPVGANYSIFSMLEADLWDAIVLNRSLSDILFLIASCLGGSQEEARDHFAMVINKWLVLGFVSLETNPE
jgi:hypothetical protein